MYVCACLFLCILVGMCVGCESMYVFKCVCSGVQRYMYAGKPVYVCLRERVQMCVIICVYVCIQICVWMCVYGCVCM